MVVLIPGRLWSPTLTKDGERVVLRKLTHIEHGLGNEIGAKELVGIHIVSDSRANEWVRLGGMTLATAIP